MIDGVGNQQTARAVEHDAVRLLELDLLSRLSIPGKPRAAISGDRRHDAGACIDPANHMIACIGDKQISIRIGSHLVRPVESRLECRSTITAVADQSGAGDASQRFSIDRAPVNAMIVDGRDPNCIASDLNPEWIAQRDRRRRSAWLPGGISAIVQRRLSGAGKDRMPRGGEVPRGACGQAGGCERGTATTW